MQIIRNQKGSLLVMTIGLVGVLALILPMLMMTVSESSKRRDSRRDTQEFIAMLASFRSQVENPMRCYQILGGVKVPANYNTYSASLHLNWTYNGTPASMKFGKNWMLPYTDVSVQDIKLYRSNNRVGVTKIKTSSGFKDFDQIPLRVYVYPSNLRLNFNNEPAIPASIEKPEAVPTMAAKEYMIRVIANVDQATGEIYNCFGFASYAAACQNLGGAFNHIGPFDLKCQPDKNCFSSNLGLVDDVNDCKKYKSSVPYQAKAIGVFGGKTNYLCKLCRDDL